MRHLRVLEDAGLLTTRRDGRFKLHYLNPIPVRTIHDRWIRPYQEPLVGALTEMKAQLEGTAMSRPRHVYEVYIRTTPEALWSALTDPEQTRRYWYHALNRSSWQPGAQWTSESETGEIYLDGTILEIDPPRHMAHTFHVNGEPAMSEEPSKVTIDIEPVGGVCKLTVVHEDLGPATEAYISGGWATILSGLKTLLETGEELQLSEPVAAAG